jgi:hypothetical protein
MLTGPLPLQQHAQPKFSVTMATKGHLKIAKNHYFALIFSIKIDFKLLQLLNGLR